MYFAGNASGDLKLKPLFIHTAKKPRAMKNVNMENLPVYWASNKKAWMLSSLYREWFEKYFIPPVRRYCERKKIPFKILLLSDNCTAHPDLNGINPNVHCMYLPPNTTALIQPMDQGVISTVKAIYKKITFTKAHEKCSTMIEFLKTYNILNAVENFGQAWGQITKKKFLEYGIIFSKEQ